MNDDSEALALIAFGDGYETAIKHVGDMECPFVEMEDSSGTVRQYIDGEVLYAMITKLSVYGGEF